jgi:hypothetical protein
MVLTVIGILLLVIFVYLLLMPLELCIDSYRGKYYLQIGFLARLSVEKDPAELLRLHLKVLFLNFFWRPSDLSAPGRWKKKPSKKEISSKKRKITLRQGRRLLQSFKVKAFRLELDTGNPLLNAQLFPLSFLWGTHVGKVGINFMGRNNILLQIANRPIYILNAFINPKK